MTAGSKNLPVDTLVFGGRTTSASNTNLTLYSCLIETKSTQQCLEYLSLPIDDANNDTLVNVGHATMYKNELGARAVLVRTDNKGNISEVRRY